VISSSSGVIVADIHGSVHLLNRDFEPVSSWVAHVDGRVTHMVERKDVLVTLGVGILLNIILSSTQYPIGRRRCSFAFTKNLGYAKFRPKDWCSSPSPLDQNSAQQPPSPGEPC